MTAGLIDGLIDNRNSTLTKRTDPSILSDSPRLVATGLSLLPDPSRL